MLLPGKLRLGKPRLPRLDPAIGTRTVNLAFRKITRVFREPSDLFGKFAFPLDDPPSMMTIIGSAPISAFAFHSITPLGIRPSLQRNQGLYVFLYRPSVMEWPGWTCMIFTSISDYLFPRPYRSRKRQVVPKAVLSLEYLRLSFLQNQTTSYS
jgi:hypothetical protein